MITTTTTPPPPPPTTTTTTGLCDYSDEDESDKRSYESMGMGVDDSDWGGADTNSKQ